MLVETTEIPGVLTFTPVVHGDARGSFTRTFDAEVVRAAGIDPDAFVQDSLSRSHRGVVRGLHLRSGRGEGKLVRCSFGEIYDVVVDLRVGSPTYLRWLAFALTDQTHRSVYIPAGCAHGFQAMSEPADTSYRIDRPHSPGEDVTIAHDDPSIGVIWPLSVSVISNRDRLAENLTTTRPPRSPEQQG